MQVIHFMQNEFIDQEAQKLSNKRQDTKKNLLSPRTELNPRLWEMIAGRKPIGGRNIVAQYSWKEARPKRQKIKQTRDTWRMTYKIKQEVNIFCDN